MRPRDPHSLVNILFDPFDVGACLREAVKDYCASTGQNQADVARAVGLAPSNLSRALSSPNTRPETARVLCQVLGLKLTLTRNRF